MSDQLAEKIGEYEIIEKIGQGGFAIVYKTRDPNLNRVVALKVLHMAYAERRDVVKRFLAEAGQTAQLRHDSIVHIFDVGEHQGRPYIAMEYLPGGNLRDRLAGNPLPLETVVIILERVATALDHAHEKDLVHRDVKPANILFDEKGHAVLADFGLVKSLVDSGMTPDSTQLGTPNYMSPEQCEPGTNVGPATDIYALGVVAYEMLTGRVPFQAENPLAVLNEHLHAAPPDPCVFNKSLDKDVAQAILRALAKDPGERPKRAGDFAKSLELANLYAQGVAHLRQEEWREAQQCFQAIVDIDPIYKDVGDKLREARHQESQRENLNLLYRQGVSYARRSDWQNAIARFKAVLELDKGYGDTADRLKEAQKQQELDNLYNQGMEHFDRGEWSQAIQQFQSILDMDPVYGDVATKLAEAQQRQELWQMYRQAGEHFEKEEWQKAIQFFGQVIERDKNYRDVGAKLEEARLQMELDDLYARALQHEGAKEWVEAGDLYLQIQTKRRGYRDTTLRLVEVDKQEKLARLYRQARELVEAEDWPAAVVRLHEIHSLEAGYEDVAQLLKDAEGQDRLLTLYNKAEGLLARANWSQAIEALQEVLTIDSNYEEAAAFLKKASYRRGVYCHEKEQLEEAIQCFERAGDYEGAQERLAKARRQKGCHDLFEAAKKHCDQKGWLEAQETIAQLRQLDGYEAFVKGEELTLMETYSRGMEHFDRGEWWKAIEQLRRVKRMKSDYRRVSEMLERALDRNLLRRAYTDLKEVSVTPITRVYKAWGAHSEETVAIKMLAPSFVKKHEPWGLIEAMRSGADATQRLEEHPHIVKVRGYEVRGWVETDEYMDVHIVVMDYVDGKNLATVLNERKKLRVGEALLIAEQVCQALVYAHSRGVFHGDIKPSNILLVRGRHAMVTDFANASYGTRDFRPPEQARMGGEAIGAHTDIYALGQVICKLVTGTAPFRAEDAKSSLPESLERLMDKATRRDPGQRYRTAQEMLAAIRTVKRSLLYHMLVEWSHGLTREGIRRSVRILGTLITVLLIPTLLAILAADRDSLIGKWWNNIFRPSPTATPTPTRIPPSISALVLVSPKEGTSFEQGESVKLQWEWEQELAGNEFFEVRIRPPRQREFDSMTPTKLSSQLVPASELKSGTYEWQVAIVSFSGEEKGVSQMWSFEVR
jgi:serine/threonine protein kinase